MIKCSNILLSLFILSISISCTDDDDGGNPITASDIAGTYNIVSLTGSATYTDSSSGVTEIENSTVTGSNFMNATVTFTNTGTVSSTGSYTLTETFIENGIVVDEFSYEEDVDLNASFSINGNEIILSGNADGATIVEMENLTDNGLHLVMTYIERDTDFSLDGTATYVLVKQ